MRIENLSDQLSLYAHEVTDTVCEIKETHYLKMDVALKCVEIATLDMLIDVLHRMEGGNES